MTRTLVPHFAELFSETETRLTFLTGVIFLAGIVSSLVAAPPLVRAGLYLAAIVVGGVPIVREAWGALTEDRRLSIDSLVVVAVIGAVLLGEWWEAAAVVFLFSLSEMLEDYTLDRAHHAIHTLMELSPDKARIKTDGRESTVPVESVAVGTIVVVRPGERVPVDGEVITGALHH